MSTEVQDNLSWNALIENELSIEVEVAFDRGLLNPDYAPSVYKSWAYLTYGLFDNIEETVEQVIEDADNGVILEAFLGYYEEMEDVLEVAALANVAVSDLTITNGGYVFK